MLTECLVSYSLPASVPALREFCSVGFWLALIGGLPMFVLATLLVSSQLLAVADSVPVFDVKKSCRGSEILSIVVQRNTDACKESEEATRDQLKKSWGEFSARDKVECIATSQIGGHPSYADLITCLEMRRDVQKLRAAPSDSDGAAGSRRKRQ
jgi:hypothetical protein